jgi:hypothetical protein
MKHFGREIIRDVLKGCPTGRTPYDPLCDEGLFARWEEELGSDPRAALYERFARYLPKIEDLPEGRCINVIRKVQSHGPC